MHPDRPANAPHAAASGSPSPRPVPAPSAAILERNLQAIARTSQQAARAIRLTQPAPLAFCTTDEPAFSATLDGKALASKRRPSVEAARLIDTIDLTQAGAIAVAGFGLGHHVEALVQRMGLFGVVIVFEPDAALLRAVLERIDCSRWLAKGRVILVTEPDDLPTLAAAMHGLEALAAIGLKLLEHPASADRLGQRTQRFFDTVGKLVRAVRTTVATTLVQVEPTLRNLLQNLDRYATCDGIADLAGTERSTLGVVVSAGPSLERNIDRLAAPGVRDRCVIVAVQTVLKPMLARGIKPHYVVALDHHEISRRFYEGLTTEDVEGVTLVIDPKCNPAIPEAFPGTIRVIANDRLDQLLGPCARPLGSLTPGATVAHMAYYFARHLGCDPVALIGQDLGFTDNQYYAANAAIHEVWAGELNEFRTLEMLEWERIARERHLLTRVPDQRGNPIYTDEQMHHYLTQFERDFQTDAARGLTTIDATEGGVAKRHTLTLSLADTLLRHATGTSAAGFGAFFTAAFEPAARPARDGTPAADAPRSTGPALERLRTVRQQAFRIEQLSRDTADLLEKVAQLAHDPHRVNQLVDRIQRLRDEVLACEPGYQLVQHLNQTGSLNRLKDDRLIALDPSASERDEQHRRAQRDLRNVRWLADAARHLASMLDDAAGALEGTQPKITRDLAQSEDGPSRSRATRRVVAVIPVDLERGGLGTRRDLFETGTLARTLARLARVEHLDEVVLACAQPDALAQALARTPAGALDSPKVTILPANPSAERARSVAIARALAPACWRGAIGGLTCHDEAFDPAVALAAIERTRADAIIVLGPDWCLVDPALTSAIIERHLERPDLHQFAFTQAAPGLAPLLLDADLVRQLAATRTTPRTIGIGSIGLLLGYHPARPVFDPIAKAWCVQVDPLIRDAGVRLIADSGPRARLIDRLTQDLGPDASALEIARRARSLDLPPTHALVPAAGDPASAAARIAHHLETASDLAVTIIGTPERALVEAIAAAGPAALHVRARAGDRLLTLADLPIDALSVRLDAAALPQASGLLADLGASPIPWVVPRIIRTDATLAQIEPLYDRWIGTLGACVIEGEAMPGARVQPLPLPKSARARLARERIDIASAAPTSQAPSPAPNKVPGRSVA